MARSVLSFLLLCLTILVLATGYPTDKDEVRLRSPVLHHDDDLHVAETQVHMGNEAPFAQLQFSTEAGGARSKRSTSTSAPADMVAEASETDAAPADMVAEASDTDADTGTEDEAGAGHEPTEHEPVADSQHFFPSFSPLFPPLGHSRPPFYQEQTFTPRQVYKPQDNFGYGSGNFRDYSFPHATAESERSANVLGSGNFGVLRGGTYYPGENDELLSDDIYNNYYNNGHGRPSFYPANPLPSFRQGGDFFANFKDFADISTPTKSSFSEFYVVYVNPNATHGEFHPDARSHGSVPRNIFEQLQIADAEEKPQKKLSKTKLKLEKFKTQEQTKEITKKQKVLSSPKEMYEPLLALS